MVSMELFALFLAKKVVSCECPIGIFITVENICSFVGSKFTFRSEVPVNIIIKDMVKIIAINWPIMKKGIFTAFL